MSSRLGIRSASPRGRRWQDSPPCRPSAARTRQMRRWSRWDQAWPRGDTAWRRQGCRETGDPRAYRR